MSDVLIRPTSSADSGMSAAALAGRGVFIAKQTQRSGVTLSRDTPPWLTEAFQELTAISELSGNWDGFHALTPDGATLELAANFLRRFPASIPKPHITPTAEGGLAIEWDGGGMCLTLSLDPDADPTVYIELGDQWWEGPLIDGVSAVESW